MPETPDSPYSNAPESTYPGERLGLPETGPGAIARFGARIGGIFIDWGIASLLAFWLFDYNSFAVLGIFIVMSSVFITLFGGSIGHMAFGMRLNTVHGQAPGPWRPWVRQLLLALVLPALVMDSDQRGVHDVASGLVLRKFR